MPKDEKFKKFLARHDDNLILWIASGKHKDEARIASLQLIIDIKEQCTPEEANELFGIIRVRDELMLAELRDMQKSPPPTEGTTH